MKILLTINFISEIQNPLYQLQQKKTFYLQMKNPSKIAICSITQKTNDDLLYDVECILKGFSTCPILDGDEIIVDIKNQNQLESVIK